MNNMKYYIAIIVLIALVDCSIVLKEDDLKSFFENDYDRNKTYWCVEANKANWDVETDLSNAEKQQKLVEVTLKSAEFDKNIWKTYFKDLSVDDYHDEDLKRKIKFAKLLGQAALDEKKLAELTNITNTMINIYSTAKICPYKNQNCDLKKDGLSLDPEIQAVLANSRDYDELSYVWKSWRDESGAKIRSFYGKYVELSNEGAKLNGFKDASEEWLIPFETPDFISMIDDLWRQVEPLYSELHKYVSRKLKKLYGDKLDISDGLLPAHLLGNMWAQEWTNLEDILQPFPNAAKTNITEALINKGFTVRKMFETADDFYKSMGLISNDMSYDTTKGAVIEKPTDGREMVCHASAWDFCDRINYRIKMCTKIEAEDFTTVHHEMGHIEYFLLYKDQPMIYRDGANPGFHEAVGDTIALSASTPKHLHRIGVLDEYKNNYEDSINSLMKMALSKVAFLPYGLLIDKWRWDIFQGKIGPEKWNEHYWKYRKEYQKLKPAVVRSANDFDPGAKFHVAADSKYISYFIAHIAQFQFFKSLCIEAGEYVPGKTCHQLHTCDFYKSVAAGNKLRAGLSLGSSKHWSVAMKAITDQEKMDASPLLEYFSPLFEFLKKYNSD